MHYIAFFIIFGLVVSAMLLSWYYFRRYKVKRSPIGCINLSDISYMMAGVTFIPYLYLLLPVWLVGGLLAIGFLSVLYFLWEPVLRARWAVWLVVIILLGADIGSALIFGTVSNEFFIVNNVVLVLMIIGISNLWAQSGMKARDASILGGALMIYDFIATSLLPLTDNMMKRLAGLPFTPQVAWCINHDGLWEGIGIGDLLLASVFPLVMRKAFGRLAGFTAIIVALSTITFVFIIPTNKTFPTMIVLGPLMIFQYIYWIRQKGSEQTMWQYLQREPVKTDNNEIGEKEIKSLQIVGE